MKRICWLFSLFVLFLFPTTGLANERYLSAGLGFGGGAGGIKLAYNLPTEKINFAVEAGYGVGTNYSVTSFDLVGRIPLKNMFIGLGLGAASYSSDAADILGLSGIVDQGTKYGAEIFAGTELNQLQIRLGYSSVQGLIAGALYKF